MFASLGARSIRVVYQPQQTGDQRHDCHDNAKARSRRPGCEDSDFFGEPVLDSPRARFYQMKGISR
jgi:hypothetical protein